MKRVNGLSRACAIAALSAMAITPSKADMPAAIGAAGAELVATVHAEGAQIYECKSDAAGKLSWQFREPIATLLADGQTVGRHFAGPGWQLADGSTVTAKLAGRAPGATAADIPLLKLAVTSHSGNGQLATVTTIQRINTRGGALDGACEKSGTLRSVPYAADYTFLREPN